jgi:cell division control protein 7
VAASPYRLIDFGLAQPVSDLPANPQSAVNYSDLLRRADLAAGTIRPRQGAAAARAGTPGFRAPEVLMRVAHQTTAIDMWSAGVILLSLLTGRYPFFHSPDDLTALAEIAAVCGVQRLRHAASGLGRWVNIHFPEPPEAYANLRELCYKLNPRGAVHFPDSAYALLERLLELNPSKRISAREALLHPFLTSQRLRATTSQDLKIRRPPPQVF